MRARAEAVDLVADGGVAFPAVQPAALSLSDRLRVS
jgi:hypothetical protein